MLHSKTVYILDDLWKTASLRAELECFDEISQAVDILINPIYNLKYLKRNFFRIKNLVNNLFLLTNLHYKWNGIYWSRRQIFNKTFLCLTSYRKARYIYFEKHLFIFLKKYVTIIFWLKIGGASMSIDFRKYCSEAKCNKHFCYCSISAECSISIDLKSLFHFRYRFLTK